jgi:type II secretory pathway pseudopilin PulG
MVVVVITGILASLGFASLQRHVSSARGAEALNMVQSIRAAQERWRSEHMMYLDVSGDESWYPKDPTVADNRGMEHPFFYPPGGDHDDNEKWILLRPTVSGPVRFGYLVNAGAAGVAMTDPAEGPAVTWPAVPADNWYVIQAIGDTDWDGNYSHYLASSLNGEVFTENHGE